MLECISKSKTRQFFFVLFCLVLVYEELLWAHTSLHKNQSNVTLHRPASGKFPGHSFGKLSSVEVTEMGNMLKSTLPSPVPITTTKCKIHDIRLMFEKIFHIVLLFVYLKT